MAQDGFLNLTDILTSASHTASSSRSPLSQGPLSASPTSAAGSLSSTLLSTSSATSYLNHLTSLSLPSLLSEPQTLQTHAHHLTSSLTSLTHSAYPSFLALHETTESLTSALTSLSESASALLSSSLPSLEDASRHFRERSEPIVRERRKLRGVIEQGDKLQDLLDVPRLMDTCIRNGYYSEALALAAHICPPHVKGVGKEKAKDVGDLQDEENQIFRAVRAEVDVSLRNMLALLLDALREPGRKLPALWKTVNILRRMEVLEEDELALTFICNRTECLQNALDTLERESGVARHRLEGADSQSLSSGEDEARFLRKYIDMWREGVYDIIMQYNTIFLEDHTTSTSSPAFAFSLRDTISRRNQDSSPSGLATRSQLHSLLATYTSQALNSYLLPTLRIFLPCVVPTTYPAFLTQLTYCGAAFARVGFDFRALLAPLFTDAIRIGISRELRSLSQVWTDKLRKQRKPLSTWLAVPARAATSSTASEVPPLLTDEMKAKISSEPVNDPPQVLASYPPLADLTNSLLSIFNGLRLLAPVAIARDLLQALDEVLAECAQALKDVVDRTKVDQRERLVGSSAGKVFVHGLVPFMRRALVEGVYSGEIGVAIEATATNGSTSQASDDAEENSSSNEGSEDGDSEDEDESGDEDDEDDEEEDTLEAEEKPHSTSIDPDSPLGLVLRDWESWLTLYHNQ